MQAKGVAESLSGSIYCFQIRRPPIPAADSLAARRQDLLQQLAAVGDLRPGSLVPSFRKCGKPNCRCADPEHPGHGPRWILTHSVNGKTRTRTIPPGQLEATRAQIAECQRLRRLVAELINVSDQVCQARLEAGGADAPGGSEKNSAPSSSPARSRPSSSAS